MSFPLCLHHPLVAIGAVGAVVLTARDGKNAPCDDPSGCAKVWPDLSLRDGTAAPTAGTGLQASLLGAMKPAGPPVTPAATPSTAGSTSSTGY